MYKISIEIHQYKNELAIVLEEQNNFIHYFFIFLFFWNSVMLASIVDTVFLIIKNACVSLSAFHSVASFSYFVFSFLLLLLSWLMSCLPITFLIRKV